MKRIAVLFMILLSFAGTASTSQPARKSKKCVSPAAAAQFLDATATKKPKAYSASSTIISAVGNVLVVEADSELLVVPNHFDLKGNAVRFQPALSNRYTYSLIPFRFDANATDTITLKDDDSSELKFQNFAFPFAGKFYDRCFVNSNGNLTFDTGDIDPPNAETLLQGPPRIAPFFADLDPETSGAVYVHQSSDAIVVTWLKVPEFFSQDQFDYGQNTFQAVLYKDGRIDLVYASDMTSTQALVGIIPGYGQSQLRFTDFRHGSLKNHPSASFLENFHDYESVNIPGVLQQIYKKYPDRYDFVTLFSNFELTPVPGTQAFAVNVQNDIQGIGNPNSRGRSIFKDNSKYGSAGKLQNVTFFGNIHQYPADANSALADSYTSVLQLLAHEVAHRWLAYAQFARAGKSSDLLLGRDKSHWNFFLDSDGSYLEGNQISQKSGSSFVTSRPFTGYSNLDLYLMGLLGPDDVKDTYLVENAGNFSPNFPFGPESSPEPNVSFRGTPLTVSIQDVIAANGARKPDVASSQKSFQQLFVLIVKKTDPAAENEIDQVDQVRRAWESYFAQATGGKATITTEVQ